MWSGRRTRRGRQKARRCPWPSSCAGFGEGILAALLPNASRLAAHLVAWAKGGRYSPDPSAEAGVALDIQGHRYGRLTAVRRIGAMGQGSRRRALWLFRCDCGAEIHSTSNKVRTGNTQSCGCLRTEKATALALRRAIHGAKRSREYRAWLAMRDRRNGAGSRSFHLYGGRGVRVCARWDDFRTFLADMGPMPPGRGVKLERHRREGDFQPDNCVWRGPVGLS